MNKQKPALIVYLQDNYPLDIDAYYVRTGSTYIISIMYVYDNYHVSKWLLPDLLCTYILIIMYVHV